jgi:hypothetical protein
MSGPSRATFRRTRRQASAPATPRSLFRDLPRDESVPFLWGHQDRILERYEEHADEADIALELPTGTGKTLIGLLIAEWRRRARSERILYLCPTRQLVYQVGALAARYGITTETCLRPDYDGLDRWQSSEAVAISTYSALFNYKPRFTAPQVLILDDAHAAEDYVASHWTVVVDREKMADAYASLATLLAPLLDAHTAGMMVDDEPSRIDRTAVEVVPLPRWWPHASAIREILGTAVENTNEFFAWNDHVSDGMAACCLLVSWKAIVLRPLVPATNRQAEFARASQRIYMSATLGAGGELERIFGVRKITRLPVPDEWEHRSTGRRLFLLPAASLRPADMDQVVIGAVKSAGRALVLAPTHEDVAKRSEMLEAADIPTLHAEDIEESLTPFTTQKQAALILANRYDGIDLPGDDCRLLVLDGLPVAVNILERFLHQRLAATALLGERMRTRFTQGVGRATRGEGDWCAVLVGSREAYDFCARGEVRSLLHPELQGELTFGLEQSRERTAQAYLDLLAVLLEHGEDWQDAEYEIRELRDQAIRAVDPAAEALAAAVVHEVDFTYAMWSGDYPRASELAANVADTLSGPTVASYRAWWLYQAGSAAWMAHHVLGMTAMLRQAREQFRRAIATGQTLHWFSELAYGALGDDLEPSTSPEDLLAAERVQSKLRSIGFYGPGFSRRERTLTGRLGGTDHTPWEEGLTQLGELLGYDAKHPGGQNVPDSVWLASERLAIAWEVKSEEEDSSDAIGPRSAQQASGHERWVRTNCSLRHDAVVLSVLVTDRRRLGTTTAIHAGDVLIVSLGEVRELARRTIAALRRMRTLGKAADDGELRARIIREFSDATLLPSQLTAELASSRLGDLSNG